MWCIWTDQTDQSVKGCVWCVRGQTKILRAVCDVCVWTDLTDQGVGGCVWCIWTDLTDQIVKSCVW